MIEYYKKLDVKIPNINMVRGKVYDSYGIEENGKFIGVLEGENEAKRIQITRIQKIKNFNTEYNENYNLNNLIFIIMKFIYSI